MDEIISQPLQQMGQSGIGIEYFPHVTGSTCPQQHAHRFVEMLYVASGELDHRIGRYSYRMRTGDFSIINYGQSHKLTASGCELYNIYIDLRRFPFHDQPPCLSAFLYEVCQLHPSLVHNQNRVHLISTEGAADTALLLHLAVEEVRLKQAGYEDAMYRYVQLVLTRVSRAYEHDKPSEATLGAQRSSSDQDALQRIEELRLFIDAEFAELPSLDVLAASFGFSPTYLCRRFKAYTGKTLFRYAADRKLQHAMYLIRTSQEKIVSIAAASGFSDLSHFNRQFRRRFGASPSEVRKRGAG